MLDLMKETLVIFVLDKQKEAPRSSIWEKQEEEWGGRRCRDRVYV